jgi:hypothetical protein
MTANEVPGRIPLLLALLALLVVALLDEWVVGIENDSTFSVDASNRHAQTKPCREIILESLVECVL